MFNFHGSVHRNNILIYIQQVAMLHSLFYLETDLHVSSGTTTHYQERIQLYLQHMVFVRPLLLPAAIASYSYSYSYNKMQCYTDYFIWKLLYMFRVVPPPIIRSANNCIYSIWYLSDRYCYLPR
jgi:hypothetical protein